MKIQYMIIIILTLLIIFLLSKKRNEEYLTSDEAIINITKLYTDPSGIVTFNNINLTGDISGNNINILNDISGTNVKAYNIIGKRISAKTDSDEGPVLELNNPKKTGDNQVTGYSLYNMTGSYGDGFNIYRYGKNFGGVPILTIKDNGDTYFHNTGSRSATVIADKFCFKNGTCIMPNNSMGISVTRLDSNGEKRGLTLTTDANGNGIQLYPIKQNDPPWLPYGNPWPNDKPFTPNTDPYNM
jgi:hypothetical protein